MLRYVSVAMAIIILLFVLLDTCSAMMTILLYGFYSALRLRLCFPTGEMDKTCIKIQLFEIAKSVSPLTVTILCL